MVPHYFVYSGALFMCAGFLTAITNSNTTPQQELPGEYDDFRAIRIKNKLYVDKSRYISQLLESEDRFFSMCRPGRFGKSTFLQMLNSFFKNEKELFVGLDIFDKHDWRKSFPVIYLDFGIMDVDSLENFQANLDRAIILVGQSYGVEIDEKLPLYPDQFRGNDSKLGRLMDHMSQNGERDRSIVVLVDEYDWPIRQYTPGDVLDEMKHVRRLEIRSFLGPFFHHFERAKRLIRFLFLTCTTKIGYGNPVVDGASKKPITLADLTFDPQYAGMMGLSGAEMTSNLEPHVSSMVVSQPNVTFHTLVRQLRKRYNGYCFAREHTSECRLYNFHSIMSCLRERKFNYFWHPANDSKYNDLFDDYRDEMYLARRNIFNTSGLTVSREHLQKEYTLADVPLVVGMIFCGYLTFRGYNEQTQEFNLDFPNLEMRESFRRGVYKYILGKEISSEQFRQECEGVENSMAAGRVHEFVERLNNLAFKPADGTILLDGDLYAYERLAKIFEGCDFCLRECVPDENERFVVVLGQLPANWLERRAYEYGLKIELSNRSEYRMNFEFGRSAPCAINVLLKAMSKQGAGQATRGRVIQLMGINFGESGDAIVDWIGITYFEGKCREVRASHSHYLEMYAYVTNQEAYSRQLV